jgi:cyclase
MLKHRVIPCLLIRNDGLVKTRKFSNPKYVGDPINAIKIFNAKEVDELIVLDISATKEGRGPNFNLIEQITDECFMPLCYGGGISKLEEAQKLFSMGIEKVCLQTSILEDLSLITKISKQFGSQSVVVSIDIKKNFLGRKKLYQSSTKKLLDLDWKAYIQSTIKAGAGEIMLNSVDKDGTLSGMDLDLVQEVSSLVEVPVIAAGGVGSLENIKESIDHGASAVAVGSFFVFHGPHRAVLITYPKYSTLEDLFRK